MITSNVRTPYGLNAFSGKSSNTTVFKQVCNNKNILTYNNTIMVIYLK